MAHEEKVTLWLCPISGFYHPHPCAPSLLCEHRDIYVGDVLALADLDDRDLGYEFARDRYNLRYGIEGEKK